MKIDISFKEYILIIEDLSIIFIIASYIKEELTKHVECEYNVCKGDE